MLRRAVALAARLEDTLAAVAELSEDPATSDTLERLLRVLVSAKPTLEFLAPAQIHCNYLGLWTRNVPNTISEGDAIGHLVPDAGRRRQGQRGALVRRARPRPAREPLPARRRRTASARPATSRGCPGSRSATCPGDQGGATEPTRPPEGVGGRVSAPRNPNAPPRISNFAVGLLFIVLTFCACWLAFKGAPWTNKWELRAVVRQATELGPRSPVRIAGVEVGKVKKVERGRGRHVGRHAGARGRRAPDPRGRDAQGAAADLPRGQLLRRPEAGQPRLAGRRRGPHAPARADRGAGAARPDPVDAPGGHAREPQAAAGRARRGVRRRRRAVAQRGVGALGRGVHAGRDRGGGVPRARTTTTCPSSSTRAATWPPRRRARRRLPGPDRGAQPVGARAREPPRRAVRLAAGARPPARGGRSRARRVQRRLPAHARARARRAARASRRRPRRSSSRSRCSSRRAAWSRRASCRRCSTSSTRRCARWRGSSPT